MEDTDTWINDMDEVGKLISKLYDEDDDLDFTVKKKKNAKLGRKTGVQNVSFAFEAKEKVISKLNLSKPFKCSTCCCRSHCGLTSHAKSDVRISSSNSWSLCASVEFPDMLDSSWVSVDGYVDVLEERVGFGGYVQWN